MRMLVQIVGVHHREGVNINGSELGRGFEGYSLFYYSPNIT